MIMKTLLLFIAIPFIVMSQTVPSSNRSESAIEKYTPLLLQEFSQRSLQLGSPVFVRIFKQESELEIWVEKHNGFELFKKYPVCSFGFGGIGPKLEEGDGMAPEGFYFVTANQLNPFSSYHLSFNLGYPNAYDKAHGRTGSALMVHGNCVSVGCYAMTDEKIEEIYTIVDAALKHGQDFFRVHIFPFRMSDSKLKEYKDNQWYSFWKNLKSGYDIFERTHVPPDVTVNSGKYIFNKSPIK